MHHKHTFYMQNCTSPEKKHLSEQKGHENGSYPVLGTKNKDKRKCYIHGNETNFCSDVFHLPNQPPIKSKYNLHTWSCRNLSKYTLDSAYCGLLSTYLKAKTRAIR